MIMKVVNILKNHLPVLWNVIRSNHYEMHWPWINLRWPLHNSVEYRIPLAPSLKCCHPWRKKENATLRISVTKKYKNFLKDQIFIDRVDSTVYYWQSSNITVVLDNQNYHGVTDANIYCPEYLPLIGQPRSLLSLKNYLKVTIKLKKEKKKLWVTCTMHMLDGLSLDLVNSFNGTAVL